MDQMKNDEKWQVVESVNDAGACARCDEGVNSFN